MKPHQRFFGGAPTGWAISLLLLWAAFLLRPLIDISPIHGSRRLGLVVLAAASVLSFALSMWTHVSLPPWTRGTRLVTTGAFKYLRHPLYASFIVFFLGLAVWLDHWVFVIWAVAQIPVWSMSAGGEEKLMRGDFPEYDAYARRTPRFVPRLW